MADGLNTEKLVESLRKNIKKQVDAGNTAGVAKDIRELRKLEKELAAEQAGAETTSEDSDTEFGIPERNRVKRKYTMTPAALESRRRNAQKSTGPTTDEGKRHSSRNAYKDGSYAQTRIMGLGKPCKTTCPDYPCSLVADGRCSPGSDCLNKEHLVEACLAIERALTGKDSADLNDLVTFELAETLQLIRDLRRAVLDDGVIIKSDKFDKDGMVIGYDIKEHPALAALPKLVKAFGLTLTDFNLTPAAQSKVKTAEETARTLGDIFQAASGALTSARDKKE